MGTEQQNAEYGADQIQILEGHQEMFRQERQIWFPP